MLIGGGHVAGPPSAEALAIKPWFGLVLILQMSLSVLHFMIGDIWGGLMMILVSVFGFQVYRDNMEFMWAMCYGLIITMETVFDLIHLAIRVAQVPEPFFEKYYILDIILIVAPILSMIQAWMMYRVYTSFFQQENETLIANERSFSGRTATASQPPRGGRVDHGAGNSNRPHDWNTAGQGRTLG